MTQTQEFSGKDIDIAIKNACSKLDLSIDDLKYDVISEGTSGIFGIVGRKDARIKVDVPVDNRDESSTIQAEGVKSIVDEAFGRETRIQTSETPEGVDEAFGKETRIKSSEIETPEVVDVTEESINIGTEALQKMADLITDDASVSHKTQDDRLTLSIEGGNAGILIGRKGQTLDAMQFLTDKIINRKSDARVRVRVDIEGYMETRKENLKHLAYKMADKAKKTGRPATINQMSAQDRRIVHMALKDDNKVRTQSMGDGYYRRLVIFPKKKNSFKGKKRSKR